jgi:general secretion pathway protein D
MMFAKSVKSPNGCFLMVAAFMAIMGCAPLGPVVYKPLMVPKAPEGAQVPEVKQPLAEEKTAGYESIATPVFKTPLSPKLPPRKPIDAKLMHLYEGPVTINAESMPLADFIVYALGDTLKVPFIMDEKLMKSSKPVSMRMPQAMPSDRAFELLVDLLEKNSLYVEEKAGALYILSEAPADQKRRLDIRVGRDSEDSSSYILQVVPLRHVRGLDILPIVKDLVKADVQVQNSRTGNVLLLYGQAYRVKQVLNIIDTLDVPPLQDKKLFLLKLTYWQPDDFIDELRKILKGVGFNVATEAVDPGPSLISIPQLQSVLVVSPDEVTAKYILEWKDKLDRAEAAGDKDTAFSYRPKYSRASDLVASIKMLYDVTPFQSTEAASRGAASGSVSPTDSQAAAPRAATSTSAAAAPRSSGATASASRQRTGAGARNVPTGAATASINVAGISGIKISADDNRNIIIIMGSPAAYKNVLNILQGLDTPARQVLIEATIAELTLTDELKYGIEWFLKNSLAGGTYTLGTLGNLGVSAVSGFTSTFLSQTGNIQALIAALATNNQANILSTPRLTVLDNREATIQVGQDVPTVTGEISASDITSPGQKPSVLRNIQYRNTGVILKVKPTINTEGLLTLDISQEVSNPGAEGAGGSPIFLMRKISTSVVVGHGQTIALGG